MEHILLAHGSRHRDVCAAIGDIAAAVGAHVAFMDHCEPGLTAVCAELFARGARRGVVTPLLFTDAFHSRVDVPAQVGEAAAASGMELSVTEGLGTGPDMAAVLEARFAQLDTQSGTGRRILYAVGSSNAAANQAVNQLAQSVGATAINATVGKKKGVAAVRDYALETNATELNVQPLFVAPGTLWSAAETRLRQLEGIQVRCGTHLGTDLVPLIRQRVRNHIVPLHNLLALPAFSFA